MTGFGRNICGAVFAGATTIATTAGAQIAPALGARAEVPFSVGRFDLTTGGSVDPIASRVGFRTPYTFTTTLALPLRSSGFWLGAAVEGAPEMDSSVVRPLLNGGLWRMVRGVRVSIGAASHVARLGGRPSTLRFTPDSLFNSDSGRGATRDTTGDPGSSSRETAWSDVEGRVSWQMGRATLDATLGMRPSVAGFRPAMWSRVGVAYPVTNRIGLVATAGADPARLSIGVPATRFASLAVRVTPWSTPKRSALPPSASGLMLNAAGAGHYRLSYRAAKASSVELSGDFAQWKPIALRETSAGVWETTLALAPGTYHVNVRVNGERWVAPAGLPQAEDDFNGTVGVLVVR